jgi:hypothetical protein
VLKVWPPSTYPPQNRRWNHYHSDPPFVFLPYHNYHTSHKGQAASRGVPFFVPGKGENMPRTKQAPRAQFIAVQVKMTRDEHRALGDLVFDSGHGSYQSFLRSIVVEKIRNAGALPSMSEPGHDAA